MHRLTVGLLLLFSFACARQTEYDRFVASSMEELKGKQTHLEERIGPYRHFDWRQDRQQLVFTNPGLPTLLADVQFIGDLSSSSNTWLWAWANPTVIEPLRQGVVDVRAYGREHGAKRLITPQWPATEADAWQMTAIAAKLLHAEAAYRTRYSGGLVFMVLTDLKEAPPGFEVSHAGDRPE